MEKLNKKTVKNGLKKAYVVYDSIRPELSAIHTKLCSDGLELTQEQMYLLGNGYSRKVEGNQPILFNDTFINDISGSLGIYLEDYEEGSEESFFVAVQKNSFMNIAPPMIYVKFKEGKFLSIVCKVYDNHSYDVISPITKEVVHVEKNAVCYLESWYMMNSPRFINPQFRDIQQIMKESIYRLRKRRELENTERYQELYGTDLEELVECVTDCFTSNDLQFRKLFLGAMEIVAEKFEHINITEELQSYSKLLGNLEDVCSKDLIRELFETEDKILDKVGDVGRKETEYDSRRVC